MYELVGVIQRIVQETVAAMKLTDKAAGTVISISPLKVLPDLNAQQIPDAALLLTDSVRGRLAVGDKVLMLRVQGGNQYIILSKME
ncbi:DUF2577 domain-containing protein [Clostridiaceae bacterium]|nr:DUF2577 domain-containing protein [Clostridiaceae bacterium]RKI14445.1 DUF2577 domain-containing protein [bacterium 1XD21-70]